MDNNFGWNLGRDFIAHYGTPRHSGRYPWGSGAKNGKTPIHEHGEKKHKTNPISRVALAISDKKTAFDANREMKKEAEREKFYGSTSASELYGKKSLANKYGEFIDSSKVAYDYHPSKRKRMNEAADLAAKVMGEDTSKEFREWFLFSDETKGYATVSDMVNQGKTKEEISSAIEYAKKRWDRGSIDDSPGASDLAIGSEKHDLVGFAEKAISIKNGNKEAGKLSNQLQDDAERKKQIRKETEDLLDRMANANSDEEMEDILRKFGQEKGWKNVSHVSHSGLDPDNIVRILNTPI